MPLHADAVEAGRVTLLVEEIRVARDALWNLLITTDDARALKDGIYRAHRRLDSCYLAQIGPQGGSNG
jgi:hypothetical protein